jgi:dipeptidyl aminopeptidase/acylaminoacyl peptidase
LLLVIASGVIIIALVTMQSPVKHAIMQSELDALIAESGGTRLTTNPGRDENPSWSPDGAKIFFET